MTNRGKLASRGIFGCGKSVANVGLIGNRNFKDVMGIVYFT